MNISQQDEVVFGRRGQPFFELSPYHYRTFTIGRRKWRTLIHYWVASKYKDDNMKDMICGIDTPENVFRLVSKYGFKDLNDVEPKFLIAGIVNKLSQNKDIKNILLSTGDSHLVYNGLGYLAEGNRYGKLLERLREKYNESSRKQ